MRTGYWLFGEPKEIGGRRVALKTLSVMILAILLPLMGGCVFGGRDEKKATSSSTTSAVMGDGEWDLRVDRRLQPPPGISPSSPLSEADFQPLPGGPTYRVVVSDRGSRVSIRGVALGESGEVEGQRTAASGDHTQYDLGQIAGGGRFVTWRATSTPQAELAIYGYGMPHLMCLRGPLVRVP